VFSFEALKSLTVIGENCDADMSQFYYRNSKYVFKNELKIEVTEYLEYVPDSIKEAYWKDGNTLILEDMENSFIYDTSKFSVIIF